ncbi:MAG: hypothetical protein N3E37_01685 [Candidatus Micrarchaeota archaeon]|nr:hypothetical protein [Candidatus Micrarchaeota archaeon]
MITSKTKKLFQNFIIIAIIFLVLLSSSLIAIILISTSFNLQEVTLDIYERTDSSVLINISNEFPILSNNNRFFEVERIGFFSSGPTDYLIHLNSTNFSKELVVNNRKFKVNQSEFLLFSAIIDLEKISDNNKMVIDLINYRLLIIPCSSKKKICYDGFDFSDPNIDVKISHGKRRYYSVVAVSDRDEIDFAIVCHISFKKHFSGYDTNLLPIARIDLR